MYEDKIKSYIESDRDNLIALRRYFHSHPEVSKEEYNTASYIENYLHNLGLDTKRVGETGVYSEIKGNGEGKTIVLRADIDALAVEEKHDKKCDYISQNKGVSHACGHDAHTASLLEAAKYLSEHKSDFKGTVRLCFQQAEELGYGARIFIDNGYLDGADRTFGVHMESKRRVGRVSLTPGPNNASVDWFRITVKGKAAHVSTPEQGIDALYIASSIVVSLQSIVTRKNNPTDAVLIGVGKLNAGTQYNIVAESATLEGTLRCMLPEIRKKTISDIEKVSSSIADIYGAEVSFEWKDFTSPLINDKESAKEAAKVASRLFGSDKVDVDRPYSLGGDDFAEFIIHTPGVYAYIGSSNDIDPDTSAPHHNNSFDIDENALLVASELYSAYAINYLNNTID